MTYKREDVINVVRRMFPAERTVEIMTMLDIYDGESTESGRARVQMAIVKLSEGDEDKLLRFIEVALQDFRDVLFWAESPQESGRNAELLGILRRDWTWALPNPLDVIAVSAFGNVVVACADGELWRVCPEELRADRLGERNFDSLLAMDEFRQDWLCEQWVAEARSSLGDLDEGECYGFKIWPLLGGAYSEENFAIKPLSEWLAVSGDVGGQVQDLPEGK